VKAVAKLNQNDDDLTSVAAAEALFSAFGRRFVTSEWRPTLEATVALQQLGVRQQRLLDRNPEFAVPIPFLPLTRHRQGFDREWQAEWLIEAWSFSFGVGPPRGAFQDPGWQLPGWATSLQLKDAPSFPYMFVQSAVDDPFVRTLLRAARPLVRACRDKTLPDELDLLLLPWVVIDGPSHGWTLTKAHAKHLIGTGLLPLVGELLHRESAEVCVAAVTAVWLAVLQVDHYTNPLWVLRFLRDNHPSFLEILSRHLPLEVFESAFANVDLAKSGDELGRLIMGLPHRLRRVVLQVVARQNRATGHPIWNLDAGVVRNMGRDEIELLVELATERFSVGMAATDRVWSLDSERAFDEARRAVTGEAAHASSWFYSAPAEQFPALLDALEAHGRPLSWAQRWLATVLSRAGLATPRVFAMMRGEAATPS
jgi:hypothetical protein